MARPIGPAMSGAVSKYSFKQVGLEEFGTAERWRTTLGCWKWLEDVEDIERYWQILEGKKRGLKMIASI